MKLTILVEYCIVLIEGGFEEMNCKTEIKFLHGAYMPSNVWICYKERNKIKKFKKRKCFKLCCNNNLIGERYG